MVANLISNLKMHGTCFLSGWMNVAAINVLSGLAVMTLTQIVRD